MWPICAFLKTKITHDYNNKAIPIKDGFVIKKQFVLPLCELG
jgi:hypothetical protein